jgi:hypothetical protein
MGLVTGSFGNAMTMGAPQTLDTTANNGNKLSDPDKQARLELLTYVKAHFDLIAVTLLVGYLGYALYNETKKHK